MTRRDVQAAMYAQVSEEEFLQQVITAARLLNWLVYHTRDSRGSEAGYPDLTMLRGGRLLVMELKSETGKVTPEQQHWIEEWQKAGAYASVFRPTDIDVILEALA